MKKLLLLFTVLLSISLSAQKVKFKNDVVYVDGNEWAKYDGKTMLGHLYDRYFILTLGGKEFINIKDISFETGKYDTNGNPEKQMCAEVKFMTDDDELNESFEMAYTSKWLIQRLYKEEVLDSDGSVNIENLRKFKEKYSEKITERQYLIK